ncbi:MAG: hypothetical protein ACI9BD_001308 [Candidatus Marinamargulisbacteria bacterium]|jgi:hypothetical protein
MPLKKHVATQPLDRVPLQKKAETSPRAVRSSEPVLTFSKIMAETFPNIVYTDVISDNEKAINPMFKKALSAMQAGIHETFGPNIVHVYPVACAKVNNQIWGPGLHDHEYTKAAVISNDAISVVLFIPKEEIAITPPHSHHVFNASTSSSEDCREYSVEIDLLDNPKRLIALKWMADLGPSQAAVAPELPTHIVVWATRELDASEIVPLIEQMSNTRGCPPIDTSLLTPDDKKTSRL